MTIRRRLTTSLWTTLLLAACGDGGGSSAATAKDAAAADTLTIAERRKIGGRIAFVSERDGRAEVYLASPDGARVERLSEGSQPDYPAAAAPDGSALLLVSVRGDEGGEGEQLFVQPLDGKGGSALGPASSRARNPDWSPDGRWVVFESDRASFRDLFRVDRDGGALTRLTENREGNFEPRVSPDGEWIAFASSRDGDAEVYVMRADGSEQRRLTAFHRDDWGPRWSPDGRTIAFASSREGADRVFLVAPDGTGARRLTDDRSAGEEAWSEGDFAWSPDGTRIALVAGKRGGGARLRVADVATGRWRDLTDGRGTDANPAWSPDGRYLVFSSDRDGDPELYLVRADGTGLTRLTRSPSPDWLPRWLGR